MDSAFEWLQSLTPYLMYAHLVVVGIAWAIAAVIAFTSVCPESIRPHLAEPEVERFGAYFLAGVVFVLAYPGYILYVTVGIIISAFALEGVQYILPSRFAYLPDARHGAFGGFLGVVLTAVAYRFVTLSGHFPGLSIPMSAY